MFVSLLVKATPLHPRLAVILLELFQEFVSRPCAQGCKRVKHHIEIPLEKSHGLCPGDPPPEFHFLEMILLVRFQLPRDLSLQKALMPSV